MFFGTYTLNMDDNHRISMPPSFKKTLESDLYITKSIDKESKYNRLWLFNKSDFEATAEKIAALPFTQQSNRDIQTVFLGTTFELTLDPKGRVSIPKDAIPMANLTKEIVLVGVGKRIEVWDKTSYENYMNDKSATIAQEVEEINL